MECSCEPACGQLVYLCLSDETSQHACSRDMLEHAAEGVALSKNSAVDANLIAGHFSDLLKHVAGNSAIGLEGTDVEGRALQAPDAHQRQIRTGIGLCVTTLWAWLPSRSRDSPRWPWEAITMRSHDRAFAASSMPSAGCRSFT